MRVSIQTKERGKFHNDNLFKAYLGFHKIGFETITFSNNKELHGSNPEDVVVGYVAGLMISELLHQKRTIRMSLEDILEKNLEVSYKHN